MFSTQLSGLFKRLHEHGELATEDGARLLAQAVAGAGVIYIYGTDEMGAIPLEAIQGAEPLRGASSLTAQQLDEVTLADRVVIFTRHSNDSRAVQVAQKLADKGIPFVAVSTVVSGDAPGLDTLADVHLDLKLTKGMLPTETGERVGLPTSMAALFVYYGLKFTIDEILAEYEE